MHSLRNSLVLWILSVAAFVAVADETGGKGPLQFKVKLDEALSKDAVSGRLVVFMTARKTSDESIGTGFIPGSTFVCAREIVNLTSGTPAALDPDFLAYPKP